MTKIYYLKTEVTDRIKQEIIKKQFKILIVDDDVNVAETFGEVLKNRGHNVTIANEGMECIRKCQNNYYDIIFMDFHLMDDKLNYDETNGAEITDLLKKVCSINCIIFAITGDDSSFAINKFKQVGMDGVLIKPFCIDIVNKLMNSLETRISVDNKIVKAMTNPKQKKHLIVF